MNGVLGASGSRRALVGVALAGLCGFIAAPNAGAKKKHKKHKPATSAPAPSSPQAPSPEPGPTGPTRGTVTRTFANAASIAILDAADAQPIGIPPTMASPYPSQIVVSGLANGVIADIKVHLNRLSHGYTPDIDVLLAATHLPVNALIMSDVGDGSPVTDVSLVLDDAAPEALGGADTFSGLTNGTFRPANGEADDQIPAPAPTPSGNSDGGVRGYDPNGIWQLFVSDDAGVDGGTLAGG